MLRFLRASARKNLNMYTKPQNFQMGRVFRNYDSGSPMDLKTGNPGKCTNLPAAERIAPNHSFLPENQRPIPTAANLRYYLSHNLPTGDR